METIKGLLAIVYWVAGAVVYFGTAAYFFADGDNLLGFIMLFLPPAGVILPWFAATWLGVVSLIGLAALFLSAAVDQR